MMGDRQFSLAGFVVAALFKQLNHVQLDWKPRHFM